MPRPHLFKSSELGFFPNVIVSGKVQHDVTHNIFFSK